MLDNTSGPSTVVNNSNLPSADSAINQRAFDETRKIVDAFLRRSLSHNARVSSNNLKPEGFHKLNGKLKHDSQTLVEAESSVEKDEDAEDDCNRKQWEFPEPEDNHADSSINSNNSNIVMKLLDSAPYSSDSNSLSSFDEGRPKMRRKSFESAVRKSVISYHERKKKAEKSFEDNSETLCGNNLEGNGEDRSTALNRSFSEKPNLQQVASYSNHSYSKSDTTNAELNGGNVTPTVEKKPSLRRKIRNLVHGSSMKRKQRPQKVLQRQDGIIDENDSSLNRSRDFRTADELDENTNPPKRKPPNRVFLHPGMPDIEKGGSLPASVHLLAGPIESGDAHEIRRHSEFGLDRITNNDQQQQRSTRPKDLDLASDPRKKRKLGKLRKRLIEFFRKTRSQSTTDSSSCSSSKSSIPDAVAAEEVEDTLPDHPLTNGSKTDEKNASEDGILDGGKHAKQSSHHLMKKISDKPYQHRGSMSFSQGDLDNLSAPDKQKIYDEIASTLDRISKTYSRLTSRSSNPSSRMETPDSSLSHSDYFHQFKGTDGWKSAEGSRRSSLKKYRPFNDREHDPAMKAYLNVQHSNSIHQNRTKTYSATHPNSIPKRRHTHHAMTGSLDSPIREHKPPPSSSTRVPAYDVVDGLADAIAEGLSSSSSDDNTDDHKDSNHIQTSFVAPCEDPDGYYGTSVDNPGPSRIPTGGSSSHLHPSAATSYSRGDRQGSTSSQNGMDEDKLVDFLVQALISKGDQFTRSMNAPEEELLRRRAVNFLNSTTYDSFQNIAHRFADSLQGVVTETATRHPSILPVVMALNMTTLVIDFAYSGTANRNVERIVDYSCRYINQFVTSIGNSWYTMLNFLKETEEDLESIEDRLDEVSPSPSTSAANNPADADNFQIHSRNQTDDELD